MSKKEEFKVGTVVKLKSGGPDMTVKEHIHSMNNQPTYKYRCQWFAGKKLEEGIFPGDSLEQVTSEPKGA